MIRLAIERPVSTIVACLTITALGALALGQLPMALLPSLERPSLVVSVTREGASREELLRGVTEPLERRLAATRGVRSLRSETEDGRARLVVESAWQTDIDRLRIDVARRMDGALEIPVDETSVTIVGDPHSIVDVAVAGGESSSARSAWAREILVPELARARGAGRIEILGTTQRHVVVRPDYAALAARGLTVVDVRQRLSQLGEPMPAGTMREGANTRPVLIRETVDDLAALREIVVPSSGGAVPSGEIASVSIEEIPDDTIVRLDGRGATLVRVYRAPGENAVILGRDVLRRLAGVRDSGVAFDLVVVRDRTIEIVSALRDLGVAALGGVLLATLLLRFMTGNWRPTLALVVVIPTSILIAFGAFRVAGISIDVVSLAGLALAAGMIVDNSIVVLESIETVRARGALDPELSGTRAVAVAVAASTLTTVLVFVPLFYLHGVARAFFGAQAFAIVASIVASLLLSLTLTPVLARRSGAASKPRSPGRDACLALLDRLARSPVPYVAGAVAFVAGSIVLAVMLPRELVPESPSREIVVDFEISPSTPVERAEEMLVDFEEELGRALQGAPSPTTAIVYGLTEDGRAPAAKREAGTRGLASLLFEESSSAAGALDRLTASFTPPAGMRASVSFARSAFVEGLGTSAGGAEIVLLADDEEGLDAAESSVRDALAKEGFMVRADDPPPKQSVFIEWDSVVLARLSTGSDTLEEQVAAALTPVESGATGLSGIEPAIVLDGGRNPDLAGLPLVVSLPGRGEEEERATVVPLSALASVRPGPRGEKVERLDGRLSRRVTVPTSIGGAARVREVVEGVGLTGTQEARPVGEMLELSESFRQLRMLLLLSLVLVYLAVAAFYESFVKPLIVMLAVPAAAAGAFVLLGLTGQSMNVMSLIGIVLLGGIVVNQTILIVDRAGRALLEGATTEEAVRQAVEDRYRPILMTTVTTMVGMLPLILIAGEGVELRRALATSVIGGLATSTVATLLFTPIALLAVEKLRRRPGR